MPTGCKETVQAAELQGERNEPQHLGGDLVKIVNPGMTI